MFEEMIKVLATRNVHIDLNYVIGRGGAPRYSALVWLKRPWGVDKSWPSFDFTISGYSLNDMTEEIHHRLVLVEPIIRAVELLVHHEKAVKEERRLGAELLKAVTEPGAPGTLQPNMDAKAAKEFPLAA